MNRYIKCGKCGAELNVIGDGSNAIGMTCEKCIFKNAGVRQYPESPNRKNVLRIKGDGHAEVGF
jgi:C4-type Zn-finger protein